MIRPYLEWVRQLEDWWEAGKQLPRGRTAPSGFVSPPGTGPVVLLFAPHPDDETLTGALALRLMREAHVRVVNVAVTLGSRKERRAERLAELRDACASLGFQLELLAPDGLEAVTLQARQHEPARWRCMVEQVGDLLLRHEPVAIFCPHDSDGHATHIGTHYLVCDALQQLASRLDCRVIETEFWAPLADPNLMVEVAPELLADLLAATACHAGEVERNPYHLRLPAWMMDNVRRGAELLGGFGATAPPFLFAQLFRMRHWREGQWEAITDSQKVLPITVSSATLLSPATGRS
ncbi:MAG: PIG-L family deacetylase [Verrucomicrobiota bacterium]|nr:PIG-L family deacetylase [Limisphaera sp.]MDW8382926.1 PIG-L family deacetylase [Verrucomicrobiota bacterium]